MNDKFVYPQDVERQSEDTRKVLGNEKAKIVVGLFFLVNVGISFFLIPVFTNMGIPAWVVLLLQFIVVMTILVFVFRIFIFKEDEKIREHEDRLTDSFSKYSFLRNITAGESLKLPDREVPIFEYDNGSYGAFLRLYFGSNDVNKSKSTKAALERIYGILGSHGLEFTVTVSKENFSESPEARHFLSGVSKIEDTLLQKRMLDITNNLFEISEASSNVDMITIRIKTRLSYQKYDMDNVLSKVTRVLREERTSFRAATFVSRKSLIDFFREFYGLEAIDLTLMRVRDPKLHKDLTNKYVQVYKLLDENGREFVSEQSVNKYVKTASKINL